MSTSIIPLTDTGLRKFISNRLPSNLCCMLIKELIPFLVLVVGLALTPGPNMMLYISHTLSYGRVAGFATVAGITSAFVIHITATILGLTALLLTMPVAYQVLRYAGIGYLFFLAIKLFRNRDFLVSSQDPGQIHATWYYYQRGFIGNLLNPQTTILYFSLLPQFVSPEKGRVWLQNLQLGLLQMAGSTVTNLLVVLLVAQVSAGFIQNPVYQKWIRYAMSLLLAAFAVKLLFARPA